MLTYVPISLFDSPAQTLVNTVNTVGTMGKGIAAVSSSRRPLQGLPGARCPAVQLRHN